MAWLQLTVEVAGCDIDTTLRALEDMGSQATTQQNASEDSYFDLAHPVEPGWDRQMITGLFENDGSGDDLVADLIKLSGCVKEVELTCLEDQDWETLWLDQYEPIEITPSLWVYPSWVEIDEKQSEADGKQLTIIKIDPGMAFGTGTHETTRGCMKVLSQLDLAGESVLDYGCGSGILAITAVKLGAENAVGVDIDANAELVAKENAHINGVERRFTIQSGNEIKGRKFDVVVANILAYALIDLAPTLHDLCKDSDKDNAVSPGFSTEGQGECSGLIVLSGILASQADQVLRVYQENFDMQRFDDGEWVVLYGRKIR